MLVPQMLHEHLLELCKDDFETFKWYLQMPVLDSCKPIPKALLENKNQRETVDIMIHRNGEDLAVKLTVATLEKISIRSIAEKIRKTCAEGQTATSSTSSSASGPPAATMSAQQGGLILAPTVSGASTGNWNITINNK